jgi:hypothetical protein
MLVVLVAVLVAGRLLGRKVNPDCGSDKSKLDWVIFANSWGRFNC